MDIRTIAKIAKRGPGTDEFEDAAQEGNIETLLTLVYRMWAGSGGSDNFCGKRMIRTSAEVVFSKMLHAAVSNSSTVQMENMRWRVSIGSSNYRIGVVYVPNSNVDRVKYVWGTFGSEKNAVDVLCTSYQGTRTQVQAGPGIHFNSKELTFASHNLLAQVNFMNGVECVTTHIWYGVWYNIAQITLGKLNGDGYQRPGWLNRPVNPAAYEHSISGVNHYMNSMSSLMVGKYVIIEISTTEVDLIPYLTYIMGAGPETFEWNWGVEAGAARQPHLTSKVPIRVGYGLLVRDNLNAAPPAIPADPRLPGLNAGPGGVGAGSVVGDWSEDILARAIEVIARSLPIASDIEAAGIKVAIDVFAEPYRGVAIAEICGDHHSTSGYNAHLDEGQVGMPAGNTLCCFATTITEGNAGTRDAIDRAMKIRNLFSSIGGIRALAEATILPMQMATRQIGLTVPIAFAGLPDSEVYDGVAPTVSVTASTKRTVLDELAAVRVGNPSQVNVTTSMMMEVMYGCVLPDSAMCFNYGNRSAGASCPLYQAANLGECLTSVHAAQVLNGMLKAEAIGLVGIPNKSDQIAREVKLSFADESLVVEGESNSSAASGEISLLPGVHMLGHASLFLRDDLITDGDVFHVEMSGLANSDSPNRLVRSRQVPMDLAHRQAFSVSGDFDETDAACSVHVLYADFDIQRFADLRLSLPNSSRIGNYAHAPNNRQRVPGFVAATIVDSFATMIGNIGMTLVQRSTKRRRVEMVGTAAAAAATARAALALATAANIAAAAAAEREANDG